MVLYKLQTCIGQNASLTENTVCFFYSCDFAKTSTVGLEMNCIPQTVTCPEFFSLAGQEKIIRQLDLKLLILYRMTTGPWHFCS